MVTSWASAVRPSLRSRAWVFCSSCMAPIVLIMPVLRPRIALSTARDAWTLWAGDIVVVPARFLGHTGQELFVIVGPEAEEGAGDAPRLDVGRVLREGSEVLDTGGRVAVGEYDQAGRAAWVVDACYLLQTEQ